MSIVQLHAELQQLQQMLADAFPGCTHLNNDPFRGITSFQPHLSIGQWRHAAEAEAALQVSHCLSHALSNLK